MRVPEDDKTVESVVSSGLCTGCGTCAGLCPNEALVMAVDRRQGIYIPQRSEDKCTNCGYCIDVCPGRVTEISEAEAQGISQVSADVLIGEYLQCYLGHAADQGLRYRATSGGLVSAVLLFALENGMIDGALVTRMKPGRPLEPEPFVARSREEILQATGSKYCPVPANLALREILEREGRYAVVGLPCQIAGIRKAEQVDAVLRQRIVLHCGIFCSHQVSFRGTEMILGRLGIGSDEVTAISYRGQGWPGGVRIALKDRQERFIPNEPGSLWDTMFGGFFYTPTRCLVCSDVVNEAADISFGDAWLPEIMANDTRGTSVLIARSAPAIGLLKSAAAEGVISLKALDSARVVQSQRLFIHFKKRSLGWRLQRFKRSAKQSERQKRRTAVVRSRLAARLAVMNSRGSYSLVGTFLLKRLPHIVLRKYVGALRRLLWSAMETDSRSG